ncbi:MAG: serine/threonine dehydratase [Acidimicrobiales bacterium]
MNCTPDDIADAARRIAGKVRYTPILEVAGAELGHDTPLVFKLEYTQFSGTFKARGATNFLAASDIGQAGVVAASGGNHGAAVAWAAQRDGLTANIFVPTISAPAKVDRLRTYGAIVHQVGNVYAESLTASQQFQAATGATAIHAYEDSLVLAGAGTTGLEFEAQTGQLDSVLVATGGGGLAGGIATYLGDRTTVVVCETHHTTAYASAAAAGGPVDVEVSGIAADALGASRIGDIAWEALSSNSAQSVLVGDDHVVQAKNWLWDNLRIVVEPSAATALAALLSGNYRPSPGERIGIVLCGANTSIS